MTLTDFISMLTPAFMESGTLLTPETHFKELADWNSLAALMMITTIGQECGVSLDSSNLFEADTIEDLYKTVCAKQ